MPQIKTAYLLMANEARYRPTAPSDGFGHITVSERELNLEKEQSDYARSWWEQEEKQSFELGCCDFVTRPIVIFAIEAVQNLNAGITGTECGLKLLEMAIQHLKAYMATDTYRSTIQRINSRRKTN